MICLHPTVLSVTMAEVKELERHRLFMKHLERTGTVNIDPNHWRQDRPLEEPAPALFTNDLTKSDEEAPASGAEDLPRATSPTSSVSSINDEIRGDEGLLPLRRSRRIEARRQLDNESEERRSQRSQLEARISGAQRRLQAIRLDSPSDSPAGTVFDEPSGSDPTVPATRAPRGPPNSHDGGFVNRGQPNEQGAPASSWTALYEPSRPTTPFHPAARAPRDPPSSRAAGFADCDEPRGSDPTLSATRAPRDPPSNRAGGFVDRGQPDEQGPSDLSLMINDEPSSQPSTPAHPAAPSSQPSSPDQASTSQIQPQSDGAQDTTAHGFWPRRRELVSDVHPRESVPRPPSPDSPSSPTLPRTPSRFQIYNDSLPASSQPQTPQNLPEARYRSRIREFWTAPAGASSSRAAPIRTPTTNRVRRLRGHRSPPGLRAPEGFMGLYGGTENINDSLLYEQASRALQSEDP